MSETAHLHLFHGTDLKYVQSILNVGFVCRENKEHWLGNGIYFFIEKDVARWWTTKPSRKFGSKIKNPAVVECDMYIQREKLIDTTVLADYNRLDELSREFVIEYFNSVSDEEPITAYNLRCLLFNWLFKEKDYFAFKVPFTLSKRPYCDADFSLVHDLSIQYNEIQVCLREDQQRLLYNKKICDAT